MLHEDRYYLLLPDTEIYDAEVVSLNPLVEMIEIELQSEHQQEESFMSEYTKRAHGWNF